MEPIDVVVLAGGRVSGGYAEAAGTSVKALAEVGGVPVLRRVVEALRQAAAVERVVVVGPAEVRGALDSDHHWQEETPTALGNLLAGMDRLGAGEERRLLICGSDVPFLHPDAIHDFVRRAPEHADLAMPVVSRERFLAAYPEDTRPFMKLRGGAYTGGSQFLIRPNAVRANQPLLERLFEARKSQLGMARVFGPLLMLKFLTGMLSIDDIEGRASRITRCHCRAVLDCHPELALDIDSLEDLKNVERRAIPKRETLP